MQPPPQVIVQIPVGPDPIFIVCPQCRSNVQTVVSFQAGSKAYVACTVMALFGMVFGCCLIPFFIESFNYKVHRCPLCHCYIGRYGN